MIPEQFRLIATSAALVRTVGPAAAIWVGNAISAQDWSNKEHGEEWWWATKAEIEERTGLSDEMQESARRRLRDLGILKERRGIMKRGAALATIWYLIDYAVLAAIVPQDQRQSIAGNPGKRTPGNPVNDHTSLNASLNTKKRHVFDAAEFDSLIPLDFQTEPFVEAWHLWVKDRKDRRRPVTELGAKGSLAKLAKEAKNPRTAEAWIKHAIVMGWQGIYAPTGVSAPPPSAPAYQEPAPQPFTAEEMALVNRL